MTIKELIEELKKYPEDTEVCAGVIEGASTSAYELIIEETHAIGSREIEDQLMIMLACNIE
ncbi:hypothetical protein [Marinifilum flexuosum]|uniref:hypothetical protein n=1 Tax=Marinifilum flexuosum TaxID=1117708 RepID=UPI0024943056|nr:hypothetical protein [Marinifilum flexuosum]